MRDCWCARSTEATLVPTAAIQRNAQGAFVYVVQTNQTVAMRPVTVGTTDGNVTAVEGLEPGEIIAADNFNRLQEGMKSGAYRNPAEEPKQRRWQGEGRGHRRRPAGNERGSTNSPR